MTIKYRTVYEHYEVFAAKIDVSRATVNNWERMTGENIHAAKKEKIAQAFGLRYEVWADHFYTEQEFIQHLDDYQKIDIVNTSEHIQHNMIGDIIRMTVDEEDELVFLKQESSISTPGSIEKYSPDFMFALAYALKDNNQIHDALRIIDVLLQSDRVYKYKYHNQILHLKAILLSHDDMKKWDEAIDILRLLYGACAYHTKEPEIITLTASNYKRKALYNSEGGFRSSEEVDRELIGQSIALYREAYGLKDTSEKYYDAINIASLTMILSVLEETDISEVKKECENLYSRLQRDGWKVDSENWWEVATQMEFLVLLGQLDEAKYLLDEYLEFGNIPKKFDTETVVRQFKLYAHFVKDSVAQAYLEYLQECLLYLKN